MNRRVYLYAFNETKRVVKVKFLQNEAASIFNIKRLAKWMRETDPERVVVYAVSDRAGLHEEFNEAMRSSDFTKWIEFEDMVRYEGKDF